MRSDFSAQSFNSTPVLNMDNMQEQRDYVGVILGYGDFMGDIQPPERKMERKTKWKLYRIIEGLFQACQILPSSYAATLLRADRYREGSGGF